MSPFKSEEHHYAPLPDEVDEVSGIRGQRRKTSLSSIILIAILLISNIMLALSLRSSVSSCSNHRLKSPYTGLDRTPVTRMEGYRRPEYLSSNESLADSYWDAVNLGHGIVALDIDYAVNELHLPHSRPWQPDASKYIYAMAAYHSMHCVPYIRSLVKKVHAGAQIGNEAFHHALHCLDILREEIMCTADDALLTMPMAPDGKRRPVGYQQERQCTNWAALRDWATEHSAGYLTYEDHPGVWHWGVNYPATDGWLVD